MLASPEMEEDLISRRKCHIYTGIAEWKYFPVVKNKHGLVCFFLQGSFPQPPWSQQRWASLTQPRAGTFLISSLPYRVFTYLPSPSPLWGLMLILLLLKISSSPPRLLVTWGCKGEKNWAILWKCGRLKPSSLWVLGALVTQRLQSARWVFIITGVCPASSVLDVLEISTRYICFSSSKLVHYL